MKRSKEMDEKVVWLLNYTRENPSVEIPALKTYEYLFKLIAETNIHFVTIDGKIWMIDLDTEIKIVVPNNVCDF
jgi:hypothetical protein